MKDNPLKWLIKAPIYLLISPFWLICRGFEVIAITFDWAFSNGSWKEAYHRHKAYEALHNDY